MHLVRAVLFIVGAIIIVWLAAFIFDTVTGISAKAWKGHTEITDAAVTDVGWRRRQTRRHYRNPYWRGRRDVYPYSRGSYYANPYWNTPRPGFRFNYWGPGPYIRFGW